MTEFFSGSLITVAIEGSVDKINLILDDPINRIVDLHGWTALHHGAEGGNIDVVKVLLHRGANPNIEDKDGQTALHKASGVEGNKDIVKELLNRGAQLNIKDVHGQTALHMAASSRRNEEIVRELLHQGANPNIEDTAGQTALHKASRKNEEIVKELLNRGANPNVQDKSGQTALHCAANSLEIVKVLLNRGVNPNIQDRQGETALHMAVLRGKSEIVKELLNKGANPNIPEEYGQTALHMAFCDGEGEIAKELLDQGADPNVQDEENNTALHFLCRLDYGHCCFGNDDEGNSEDGDNQGNDDDDDDDDSGKLSKYCELLDLVLMHPKVDVNLRNNKGKTPLALALNSSQPREAIQKLIHCGASVTDIMDDQSTALHLVLQHYRVDMSVLDEILSHENIGINQRDGRGNTALMYACERRRGHDTICLLVERLLTKGAKAGICKKSGETPLHAFCTKKYSEAKPEVVSKLIDLLVQSCPGIINAKDEKGWTPLHTAIWNESQECAIDLLAREGIAVNEKTADEDEWTPLHIAFGKRTFHYPARMFDIVKKLIDNGADLNSQDGKGNTPLHLACSTLDAYSGEWAIVRHLLENEGIQFHTLNQRGFTPLMAAAKANSSVDFLFKLLSHTGGTLLGWKQVDTRKRSHSMAFEEYDTEEDEGDGRSRSSREGYGYAEYYIN